MVNAAVIDGLRDQKVIRSRRQRIYSTVVEADIHYPTDSQLIADGIPKVTRVGLKIRELLGDGVERLVDHGRSVKRRLLLIAKHLRLRTGQAVESVREVTIKIAQIANTQMHAARRVGLQGSRYWPRAARRPASGGSPRRAPHPGSACQSLRSGRQTDCQRQSLIAELHRVAVRTPQTRPSSLGAQPKQAFSAGSNCRIDTVDGSL